MLLKYQMADNSLCELIKKYIDARLIFVQVIKKKFTTSKFSFKKRKNQNFGRWQKRQIYGFIIKSSKFVTWRSL